MLKHYKFTNKYVRTSYRRGNAIVWWIIIISAIVLVGGALIKSFMSDPNLLEDISCDYTIRNGKSKNYNYVDLGDALRIDVEISSSEPLTLTLETIDGLIVKKTDKILRFNQTISGPSIAIELKNDLQLFGEKAKVKGSIKIFKIGDEI